MDPAEYHRTMLELMEHEEFLPGDDGQFYCENCGAPYPCLPKRAFEIIKTPKVPT